MTEVTTIVGAIALVCLLALGRAVVVKEGLGWISPLARSLVLRAAGKFDSPYDARYGEEWLAELEVLKDRPLSALLYAVRVRARARATLTAVGTSSVGSLRDWRFLSRAALARRLAASEQMMTRFQRLGDQLAERNEQLAALQFGLISTTLKTLSLRDSITARHSAAVARYSREMAKEIGLSERDQELIHTAALFHDIGKFIFPDALLLARGQLTDEEFEIIKQHPGVGADLISEIEGYGPVAVMVRHHHERIDGRGYPDGLAGEAIPLGARIIAIADVYDVITARDTYRSPVPAVEACVELRRVAGRQVDPHLVEVFIELLSRRAIGFQHMTDADFDAELQLKKRSTSYASISPSALEIAEPSLQPAPAPRAQPHSSRPKLRFRDRIRAWLTRRLAR